MKSAEKKVPFDPSTGSRLRPGSGGQGIQRLRDARQQDELPRGLLARAELYRVSEAFTDAWHDLTEAGEIAERGEMKLHLADYHLEAARLSLAEGKKDQAREHLATAREMIEEMGYGRRKGEAEEIQFTISNFQFPIVHDGNDPRGPKGRR